MITLSARPRSCQYFFPVAPACGDVKTGGEDRQKTLAPEAWRKPWQSTSFSKQDVETWLAIQHQQQPRSIIAPNSTRIQIKTIGIFILLSCLSLATTMASRRALQIGGATIAVGGVYYLYSAGGNPKVAEKKLERAILDTSAREQN